MPTPYADLNAVIAELVSGAREILGENFCGAYLQGSFAVGEADEHSDVDFVVVIERELTDAEQRQLQAPQAGLEARSRAVGSGFRRAGMASADTRGAGRSAGSVGQGEAARRPERVDRTQAFMDYVSRAARASAETRSAAR